ncbi:MAG: hypothetical protein H6831_14190 [Planctomycetes bacterium]|nr:hypothetical protein [Planctomycetota bacterium]MCB9905551.1 hypothetical protein [Planctomycetota bacterium]
MTTSPKASSQAWRDLRVQGWRDKTGRLVSGLTLFLLVTGLSIYLLPFSVFNQHAVVLHSLVGLAFVPPATSYLVRHIRAYWDYPLTHIKFSGYAAAVMLAICSVSGVVLTWQGVAGTQITYVWRTTHNLTTWGVLLFLGAHFASLWARARATKRELDPQLTDSLLGHSGFMSVSAAVLMIVTGAMTFALQPVEMVNEFPADYDLEPYEGAGVFSPSLARTESGGALDARTLAGSASCGTSRCHEEIYQEWLPSAHRYASMDVGFQAIQGVMAKQNGAVSTRYCGGCHDPISLFSGTKNIGVENLTGLDGYQEGISCLACHAIEKTDIAGNANYVMSQPERYVWEQRGGPVATFLADYVIRTYPDHHVDSLSRRMFKTPEFCAACHKQFIDESVNQVGWVQLQNQFDNWRASRWFDESIPERTVECRECHMPLQASHDPAAGDEADSNRTASDGRHRSHRFLGANQYVPALMELEGAEEHVALVHSWLKGEVPIPEIANKWTKGPAVPIELQLPESVNVGDAFKLQVHIINNKVGHDFPTGPLDIIQAWLHVEVTDANGVAVFHSGRVDDRNFVETGTFMFKAEPVDRYGNLIDRHNLWEMVGVRFKRSLFPGSEEVANFDIRCSGAENPEGEAPLDESFEFAVPADLEGPLSVTVELNYRKFDQYLLNFAFGEEAGLTAPITTLSSATGTVSLARGGKQGL